MYDFLPMELIQWIYYRYYYFLSWVGKMPYALNAGLAPFNNPFISNIYFISESGSVLLCDGIPYLDVFCLLHGYELSLFLVFSILSINSIPEVASRQHCLDYVVRSLFIYL